MILSHLAASQASVVLLTRAVANFNLLAEWAR
jgi:hypothetical protein